MNQTQIAAVYDSMTPEQQNMPREQFIRQAMDTLDPTVNTKILDHMVQQKRQVTQGRIEQARIDAVLRERKR
jgi:hypothetical protein